MQKLKRQGFFREMPHGEENDPSIKDWIFLPNYGDEKAQIIDYLHSGKILITCCGTCNDIVKPENGIAGVASFLTDGKWVWPGDLVYYVEKYNLKLDPVFLDDMKKNHWKINVDSIKTEELKIMST